ncbi:FecR family protein [Mucilaginibacter phyllosphaerae]|uniref:DUF4974 domain-containing protein n=1 Tax=Mucilaginibacter phyllosphaerae TaxID=1812349 RepID=A0A4Y8AI44_9SPHI|nr:FecR domain-containing protein [Mucilaginibacter phyllosphaerae]MBB3968250.1 ferric-dicitrate binding protein FerR (iron transport regulator) [Mucilaginibacter phyllosphaerae]TEW68743.1 DUF4974 domain-containing protein [Mucilaginibacter phyllosphaerae]GGH00209.1 hypothetical protein GCM10007352_01410 [Mucilaginibacter phyllosphaerae]
MGKSRFIDLMAKSLAKTATVKELAELEVFLKQFPRYQQLYNTTNAIKGNDPSADVHITSADKIGQLWDHINSAENNGGDQVDKGNTKRILTWQWAAAAAVFFCVLGGVFYFNIIQSSKSITMAMHKMQVPYGNTRKLIMPDGTEVTLNAGSTLTYPGSFAGKTREVTLTGEGFFKVVKNPRKPFLVHTQKLTVTVLGTVFNVKAYANDKTTETTLLTGKVQVDLNNNPEKKVVLMPNEKLIVANDQIARAVKNQTEKKSLVEYQVISLPVVSPGEVKETAWLDKRIVFTNESFEDVAKQIERKYNVQIIFDDVKLKSEQISGLLDKESLPDALRIIEITTPFNYRINGKVVYLSPDNK